MLGMQRGGKKYFFFVPSDKRFSMSVINSVTHSASRGEHSFEGGSEFTRRHVGPGPLEQKEMLQELGCESLEQL